MVRTVERSWMCLFHRIMGVSSAPWSRFHYLRAQVVEEYLETVQIIPLESISE